MGSRLALLSLVALLPLTSSLSGRTFRFSDEVHKGGNVDREIGSGLHFCLIPLVGVGRNSGWIIRVGPSCRREAPDFSGVVTPPFHGPNALEIQAWYFDPGANAPHDLHEFQFVLNEADYDLAMRVLNNRAERESAKLATAAKGQGSLTITGRRMSASDGSIDWIRFTVRLEWPKK